MEGGGGNLQRPADSACLIREEVWALMSEEDRRWLIGVVDRTKARILDESHFAPAPPGCSFKAMMPGEGYWELIREEEEEERARQAREERARREREELERQQRVELAFQQREAMLLAVQAHDSGSGRGQKRKAVEPEMDAS